MTSYYNVVVEATLQLESNAYEQKRVKFVLVIMNICTEIAALRNTVLSVCFACQ